MQMQQLKASKKQFKQEQKNQRKEAKKKQRNWRVKSESIEQIDGSSALL